MNFHRHGLIGGVALALLAAGCAAGPEAESEPGAELREVQALELASVNVGETRITFLRAEGDEDITIEEQASLHSVETPMQQLWGRSLTSLEIWRALSPDQPAPAALTQAQEREARSLGRSDVGVREVKLELARATAKNVTSAQCDVMWNSPYTSDYKDWVNKTKKDSQTGIKSLCGGFGCQDGSSYPSVVTLVGLCNTDSARSLTYRVVFRAHGTDDWFYFARTALPNSINAEYWTQTYAHDDYIEGRPTQNDHVYHLRSALARHKP